MSQIVPVFPCRVTPAGQLRLQDRSRFAAFIAGVGSGPGELVYRPVEPTRSLNVNSYYWGVVVAILQEYVGDTKRGLHDDLKAWYGVASTSGMTQREFSNYVQAVCVLASWLGVFIPDPHTVDWGEGVAA